ncbi:hypothetical protein GIB67_020487 [Kingdonia uniflora]|uniref:protein-serine/threonine phosphatase n=1 Tax=Kingdonia uniflora TaxID=39325 RepID=A0A7J7MBX8_9MAGN|nr:hypothetical protein GIB67_020487 [Kingdonia uniflora]
MSCAVAVANSPVFSPSRVSLFCKTSSSSSSGSTDVSSSSRSPFRVRVQKSSPSGLGFGFFKGEVVESSSSLSSPINSSSSSSAVLKRKRPMRIDIPVAPLNFTEGAVKVPGVKEVEVEREGFSVYCKKGRREAMEDRYSAVVDLQGDPKQAFFGVFDGHGGAKAAEFASENLVKNIKSEVEARGEEYIIDAIKHGYLTTDSQFLKEDIRGGTCCVSALLGNGNLVVSNAGDCRAVMSRGGIAEALTSDHRPSREDEKVRIENLGGYVDCCRGVWRLQGSLAVSRGLGDRHLKQWVIAEPETKVLRIESDCEFLVLASDGLWDKVTNQEAIDLARPLCVNGVKPTLLTACKRLVELAVSRGSCDDISVMVIPLGNFI